MSSEPPVIIPGSNDAGMHATDAELLAAHVAGDPQAFNDLVIRHRDRLWAVALRTTGDAEEAADALQDGLISAFRNAASFRGEAAVTTWLHRVVVNASLDRLRRRKVRPTVPLPMKAKTAATEASPTPATTSTVSSCVTKSRRHSQRYPPTSAQRSCSSMWRECR